LLIQMADISAVAVQAGGLLLFGLILCYIIIGQ